MRLEHQLADEAAVIELRFTGDLQGTWDEGRICQVVSNLVGNALSHGDRSDPVVIVLDGQQAAEVTLSIENKGPVSASVLPHIFDPFRSSPKRGSGSSGLGLGLYIVQQIIKAHGGDITLDSSVMDATRFAARLPRHAATAPTVPPVILCEETLPL